MSIGDLIFGCVAVAILIYGLSWSIAIDKITQEQRRTRRISKVWRISTVGVRLVKAQTQIISLAGERDDASVTCVSQVTRQTNSRVLCGND